MHTLSAIFALLLSAVICFAETTYHVRQAEVTRQGRRLPRGSDAHTCQQATNPATPRASVNGGLACLAPGDTLRIGQGTYKELIFGSYQGSTTCTSADAAVMQPCAILKNGIDQDRPTRLIGDGHAVLSPDITPSGGGSTLTLYDGNRYLHIEGLRFVGSQAPGAASGVHLGNSQHVTVHQNEIAYSYSTTGALVKSSDTSRYHTVTSNNIHHAGEGCDRRTQGSPPCPHGTYQCGQDHWIADNWVHHNSNYGIQVSCEDSSGIARVTVAMNRVEYNKGVGIRIAGTDNKAFANQLVKNGVGMTITGAGALVAHSTFDGYDADMDDPFALWHDPGNVQIVNNLFTNQRSAWYMMQQRSGSSFVAVDPSRVHHNGCDVSGNVGCTNVHPVSAWYTDQASGDYRLPTVSPATGAGVSGTGVEADITHYLYQTPDLGSYAWRGTPVPPEPEPVPPGGPLVLACTGSVQAVPGPVTMQCTQQVEGRR